MKSLILFVILCKLVWMKETGKNACRGVISRNVWGGRSPMEIEYLIRPIQNVVVQHTVTDKCNNKTTCSEIVRSIQNNHMDNKHYPDIGLSFTVGDDGSIFEGPGWLHRANPSRAFTNNSVVVSFIGTYIDFLPTNEALNAVKALLSCGVQNELLDEDYNLYGQLQVMATLSPGKCLYEEIKNWPHWRPNPPDTCTGIVSRDDWGGRQPSSVEYLLRPVHNVIIQHTATPQCFTRKDCSERVRNLQAYHIDTLGFDDVGESFLIGDDGGIYEGPGWLKVGAHTYHYNKNSVGVAFIGNFDEKLPSKVALDAAKSLLECGLRMNILANNYKLFGHRQLIATVSPGEELYQEIRKWPHWSRTIPK